MHAWIVFLVGLIVGGTLGTLFMSLLILSGKTDDKVDPYQERCEHTRRSHSLRLPQVAADSYFKK